jgi:hypothetical protein
MIGRGGFFMHGIRDARIDRIQRKIPRLNHPTLTLGVRRAGDRVSLSISALAASFAALTTCSTACRSEVTTQSARVAASASRSSTLLRRQRPEPVDDLRLRQPAP